ncbi:MAG TPA: penicillin acylase family protein [Acidimicrobiales bacterium]|nr:penicillin acylase family protein [Acidimicrobiales bacterium]
MEIFRDGFGIPHCYADDEDEAFHAQGWVHAADRLWQLEHDRRRASGRMAEVVGVGAVAADVFFRRVDLATSVLGDHAALAPETVGMLESYARGVNAWVAANPLPREFTVAGIEFAPWEPWHSLLVFRVRHLLMGSARSKLWRAVIADALGDAVARTMVAGWGEEHLACVPPGAPCRPDEVAIGDPDGGSNNWVLAGARTASGLPLLAGDPHRELEAPNVYVQGHVACPSWDALGIGMPGVPGFPHFGHNARVAWSITHGMADDQDLFMFAPGSFRPTRTELIEVRGADAVEVDVVHTPRGPLITDELALCWVATADVNLGFDALAPMLRAASVAELFETMRPWVEPVNSLLAADVDGHIGYLLRGRLPLRASQEASRVPVPGDDPRFAWEGWVPFESLPRVEDPEERFLFSANNHIAASLEAPYVGLDVAPPWRAARIVASIGGMLDATVDDMAAVQRDVVSIPARRIAARLQGWPPLAGWDGTMEATSTAAAAYAVFRRELLLLALERSGLDGVLRSSANRILPGVVPESVLWRVVEQHAAVGDTSLLGGWTWDEAFDAARARAESVWHGETWGEIHRTTQRHVLGVLDDSLHPPSRVGVGGDLDTVFSTGYTPTVGLDVKTGSVARYAFDLADWDRSGWVVPLGSAGAPPSPHAADQQAAWAQGRLVPAPYSRAAVDAACAGGSAT